MRKTLALLTVTFIMTAGAVAADQHDKAKPGHEAMPKAGGGGNAAKIARAMSAAPPDIARGAMIMAVDKDGKMTQLRDGKNGWMCMVMADNTPMCLDKEWQGWADAWVNKKPTDIKNVGVAYMLRGDTGASNTDPHATKPAPDNAWVVSGPHLMIITPDQKQLDALPTDPHNGGPWVMWKGTPYAHIMVPTAPMPKQAAAKPAATEKK
jgi:hypothetical protein